MNPQPDQLAQFLQIVINNAAGIGALVVAFGAALKIYGIIKDNKHEHGQKITEIETNLKNAIDDIKEIERDIKDIQKEHTKLYIKVDGKSQVIDEMFKTVNDKIKELKEKLG